jgi:hypothetical protein
MKFSWTGLDKGDLTYRWLLNRGDHMGKFDCTLFIKVVNVLVITLVFDCYSPGIATISF